VQIGLQIVIRAQMPHISPTVRGNNHLTELGRSYRGQHATSRVIDLGQTFFFFFKRVIQPFFLIFQTFVCFFCAVCQLFDSKKNV
jgi:hypothetical protein